MANKKSQVQAEETGLDLKKLDAERVEKLVAIDKDVSAILKRAEVVVIGNEQQEKEAITLLSEVKGRFNRIEDVRLYFTKPLNEIVKKYNNDFKGKQEVYLQLEKKLKSALGAYAMKKEAEARKLREELEAKAKADLEKAQKEAEKKGLPAPIAQDLAPILPPEPEQTVRTEAGKVTYKDAYCFEVEDANKMPLKYRKQVFALAVEKGLVDRVVRDALKEGVTEIEGVRIWKEKQVASSI